MSLTKEQIEQLESNKNNSYQTKRNTAKELEDILYKVIPVLDHGFIRVVDYMGDDSSIVQAARVSYGAGTKRVSQDKGLINYLMLHRHTTPFEMCEIKYHIKLPIFIARQWIRHRTANVNEYSARYSILGDDVYIPEIENIASQSTQNNQGRGENLSTDQAKEVQRILEEDAKKCYNDYVHMLNETETGEIIDPSKDGVARELARMNLTLNHYTEWYWKIDLHNLFHFLSLRADSHAQYEIREYADAMLETVKAWVPMAYEAFMKYRVGGAFLSSEAKRAIKAILKGEKIKTSDFDMSKREWQELFDSLELSEKDIKNLVISSEEVKAA